MSDARSSIEGQTPIRLSGRNSPVGHAAGFSIWGMLLFGLPFVAVGVWATLTGLEMIPVDASKVNAPMWVITVCGLVFFCAGLMVWGMGWRQASHHRKLRLHALQYPNLPQMADYAWDASGYSPARWQPLAKTLGGAVFMTVFLSIFNWWAFGSDDDSIFLRVIVIVFDLMLIFVWWTALKGMIHAVKFGRTRLEYGKFPYYLGDWFQANIQLPAGLERVDSVRLVFRCVREFYEVRGRGKNRRRTLVHEQLWAEDQEWSRDEIGQWPRFLNATFTIPAAAPGSRMNAQTKQNTIFWELEMELSVPGVDLKQRYLVPVYARQ
ncbi:MAG: hypothetical protein AAF649_05610 [Verrucomicrobiota bacterium]